VSYAACSCAVCTHYWYDSGDMMGHKRLAAVVIVLVACIILWYQWTLYCMASMAILVWLVEKTRNFRLLCVHKAISTLRHHERRPMSARQNFTAQTTREKRLAHGNNAITYFFCHSVYQSDLKHSITSLSSRIHT
jgi:hypothetical protein